MVTKIMPRAGAHKMGTLAQANGILERRFKGKTVSLELPFIEKKLYGMVNQICIDDLHNEEIIIHLENKRYSLSKEYLNTNLIILKHGSP